MRNRPEREECYEPPASPVLLLSPSGRQSAELFRKVVELYDAVGRPVQVIFTVLREFGFTPDPEGTDADLTDVEASYLGGAFAVLMSVAGEVVGTVGLFPHRDGQCELRKMYLSAEYRGKGLGKRLLQLALDRARELGFRRVILETVSVLRPAIALYESFGFRPFIPDHLSAGPGRADRAYCLDLR